jgi:xylulose-5-phosphate/fructose-6-phosphate phosphoketolase
MIDLELQHLDAWWRAANYLSVGQLYLRDNPLLHRTIEVADLKPRPLGHWGTTPGLNLIYAHLNRIIRQQDLNVMFVAGPGHGAAALLSNSWLEGSYTEYYPAIGRDIDGMKRLFTQFSYPGGVPSHASPGTPGSIHEGGELGYSLSHAFGAVFDNPDLIAACVVGDGEAETGPLATSWHSNKFLNPARDGAVLPILHLNGYKISGPTVLARIGDEALDELFRGYGYDPVFVTGHEPMTVHRELAQAFDYARHRIHEIQDAARERGDVTLARWPMIILNTPKGWTGPAAVDGVPVEGTFRAHQLPLTEVGAHPERMRMLEHWMRSYRPDELFDADGHFDPVLQALAPSGNRRMSTNPHANGGALLRDLALPDIRRHAVPVGKRGAIAVESTGVQGGFMRDLLRDNAGAANFRVFSPDETSSNRWGAVFDVTDRCFTGTILPGDEHVSPDGRVMEMLSEHQCQGWLEGYLLTGRHGFFSCYEAFVHIVDSMFNQHAKWLESAEGVPWRRPVAALNYLLSSHVWRQDHNGFSHQDPGMLDLVVNKKGSVVRAYLPPDANTLLVVTDHCLRTRNCINVIVAGKHPEPQWLNIDEAIAHCEAGAGIWPWASTDDGRDPDVVLACCGDVPTLETLAAVQLLREELPAVRVRVVNVVDLMALRPATEHPHGLSDDKFDAIFTADRPVIFAFHGYPWLIHRLAYRRHNHDNMHVRGYTEEGTTTTPFDMVVLNRLDRWHLVLDVIERVPGLATRAAGTTALLQQRLEEHDRYIREHGEDLPAIREWRWGAGTAAR